MSQFLNALLRARSGEQRSDRLNWILAALLGGAIYGWHKAPDEITVHVPPDLRNGAVVTSGVTAEVPESNVYTFAFYIWQQVNRWKSDGAKDYGERIYALQDFFTPACRSQLIADMNQRASSGELVKRTRSVMEIPGLGFSQDKVKVHGNSWVASLDLQIQESVNGVAVKDAFIRYPLRIVRFDIDRERNQWQLAIDCFGNARPARLDPKAVEIAISSHGVVAVKEPSAPAQPQVQPMPPIEKAPAGDVEPSPVTLPTPR